MSRPQFGRLAPAALAGGIVGLAASPVLVRLSEVGPSATAVHRVLLAMPVLAAWLLIEQRGPSALATLARRDWRMLFLAGLFWTADLVAWHWALKLTTIANASLLTMAGPIFVTAAAWLLLRERITAGFLAGMAIALAGAWPLMATSFELGARHLLGDAAAVAASAFFAAYLLAIKQLRGRLPTGTTMCLTCLFSLPGLIVAAALSGESLLAPSFEGWLTLIGLALSAQAFGQALIALALAGLPASFTSVALLVQPFLAMLLGWLLLSEAVQTPQLIGGVVVLAGILISRRYGQREAD